MLRYAVNWVMLEKRMQPCGSIIARLANGSCNDSIKGNTLLLPLTMMGHSLQKTVKADILIDYATIFVMHW